MKEREAKIEPLKEIKAESSNDVQQQKEPDAPEKVSKKVLWAFLCLVGFAVAVIVFTNNNTSGGQSTDKNSLYADNAAADTTAIDTTAIDDSGLSSESTAQEWYFTFEKDPMTDSQNIWASIRSDNSISQDFPYHEARTTITVRYMKKYGYDVLIGLSSGQIYGSEYNNDNYVKVRFDDGAPIKYWFNEPADGSSDNIFIRKKTDFISRCKKATHIKVELPIYQGGRPIFEFTVGSPLKWRTE